MADKYNIQEKMERGNMSAAIGNYHVARSVIIPMCPADYSMKGMDDDKNWKIVHVLWRDIRGFRQEEQVLAWACDSNGFSYADTPEIEIKGSSDKYDELCRKARDRGIVGDLLCAVTMETYLLDKKNIKVGTVFRIQEGDSNVRNYANFDVSEYDLDKASPIDSNVLGPMPIGAAIQFLENGSFRRVSL